VYEVSYVEYGGRKIVCERREAYRKKPRVWIFTVLGDVVVNGDTYKARDVLKKLGFRWNPNTKAWVAPVDRVDIETVRKELEKVADVVVK
jgi:peptidoglycan/xylan/chitin deacetylase (PgdA/CDA1 family)